MGTEHSFSFGLLMIAPGLLGLAAFAYFLWRYEQSRRGQSVLRRASSDLLGPFSLVIPKAESQQSRPWLVRAYACAAFFALYVLMLYAIFG